MDAVCPILAHGFRMPLTTYWLFFTACAHALLLPPSPLSPRPARAQPRWLMGRPRKPDHGPPNTRVRRRLTGQFVEQQIDEDGRDVSISAVELLLEEGASAKDEYEQYPRMRYKAQWNARGAAHQANWANSTYRELVLAKRNETRTARRLALADGAPPPPPPPPKTAGQLRKSEALTALNADEQRWMRDRLADGAERRRLLNDDSAKRERREKRAALAKARHTKMREEAASKAEQRKQKGGGGVEAG